ncbi:MAG: hypothetical protein CR982_02320 [Candidatus Cloacimonadota bacterium]|nr:MAG: hypothetical protein CR982_02320 [Candidatus Cloacimonadota bacterium]PIE81093.1 MAG: hypothetical protein CSA15_01070 [Candidatus Delongbacteria bacterium]
MKLGIFTAFRNMHKYYVKSCEELGIEYELIDIIGNNWLDEVKNSNCDGFLCRPPSKFQERKSMFDERLYIINKWLNKPIYPSYDELFIYENKKMMSYFFKIRDIPHVKTNIFYRKEDCLDFINSCNFPQVFKTNIGSTSKGVKIIKSKFEAKMIAQKVFGMFGSKLSKGYTPQTTGKIIPVNAIGSRQKHYIIFQDFEKIKWEWRIIKIDNSYFGRKKLLKGYFASGSDLAGFDNPPKDLLLLTKKICDLGGFNSMAVDIFETEDGRFLVNELQSIFGCKNPYQMCLDGKPGRYLFEEDKFVFEEGEFDIYDIYKIRVKHFLKLLSK